MRALTLHQPWAWVIAHAGKDIENRRWTTDYRGPLAIHAGLQVDEVVAAELRFEGIPVPTDLVTGAFVAVTVLADIHHGSTCRRRRCLEWADPVTDIYHWELGDTVALPDPIPCLGARRLWQPPALALATLHQAHQGAAVQREHRVNKR